MTNDAEPATLPDLTSGRSRANVYLLGDLLLQGNRLVMFRSAPMRDFSSHIPDFLCSKRSLDHYTHSYTFAARSMSATSRHEGVVGIGRP